MKSFIKQFMDKYPNISSAIFDEITNEIRELEQEEVAKSLGYSCYADLAAKEEELEREEEERRCEFEQSSMENNEYLEQ